MIASFGDRQTERLFHGDRGGAIRRLPPEIRASARRKLDMLNAATDVIDLRSPPGNRLEQLRGDLSGFFSIRINDQWRVIFKWRAPEAHEVRIVDYHG